MRAGLAIMAFESGDGALESPPHGEFDDLEWIPKPTRATPHTPAKKSGLGSVGRVDSAFSL
jgi:hypothetical protein